MGGGKLWAYCVKNKGLNDNVISVTLYPGKLCDAINRIAIKPAMQ